jgi:replicative DNA helicase
VTDRVPPHSLDAEAAVLSAILLDAAALDRVHDRLRPHHFYADANRWVYEAIIDLRLGGLAVDIVLVSNWLRDRNRLAQVGGTPYLALLADATPAVAHVENHAAIIVEKWRLREVIRIGTQAIAESYTPLDKPQELFERVEREIAEVTHDTRAPREEVVRTIASRVITRIAHARARGEAITGTPTGFALLDRVTGGLFDTDLTIVAARPGLGKTALAQSLAANIARPKRRTDGSVELGHAVLFCTLEQPREQLAMRFASHEAEFDGKLWRAQRLKEADWMTLSGSFGAIEHLPIYIDDTPALTLGDLRSKVRRLKRQIERGIEMDSLLVPSKPLRLVIVDYLQLMKGIREKGDTREREVASLSMGLKNLAKQEELAVIAVSQLNRQLEKNKDKRPQMQDLRESGALEQDADNVWFLYRDSYYNRESPDQTSAELDIAKQRNGPNATIALVFKKEYTRYYSLAGESEYGEFDDYGEPG